MIIIIMSKILCLNIVHLNTRYQRTMESKEKMFCNFCLLCYPTFISPRALEWVMWPSQYTYNISVCDLESLIST